MTLHPSPLHVLRFWLTRTRQIWMRTLIILSVLAISAAIVPRDPEGVLFLLVGAAAVLVFWRRPQFGPIAMIPACQIVSLEIDTGTQTVLHAGIFLLGLLTALWFLKMLIYDKRITLPDSRPVKPLLLFLLVVTFAFVGGQLPWFPLAASASLASQLGGLSIFLLSGFAFLLVGTQIDEIRWLKWLVGVFLGLGVFYLINRVIPQSQVNAELFQHGFDGSMFWVWMVALASGQAFFNPSLSWPKRLFFLAVAAATFGVAFVQLNDWKSGWIPPLVVILILVALWSWRYLFFFVPFAIRPAIDLANMVVNSDLYSLSTRIDAWLILLKMIKVNPILGLGPANYHWYTPLFPIRGYYVTFNSHNQYMDFLAQAGILGLLLFLWFAWETGRLGWSLRTAPLGGFGRGFVYGALAGLGGTLVSAALGDWLVPFVYNVAMIGTRASFMAWLFLGGLVALDQIRKRSTASAN